MAPARKRKSEGGADGRTSRAAQGRDLERAAQLFDLLSDPIRLRILLLLDQQSEMTGKELRPELGITQSGVSTHLKKLRLGRLVESRRDGHFVLFRLASAAARNLVRRACRLVEGEAAGE
jgi:DNA-binding transcriptional ArsR family regulator